VDETEVCRFAYRSDEKPEVFLIYVTSFRWARRKTVAYLCKMVPVQS